MPANRCLLARQRAPVGRWTVPAGPPTRCAVACAVGQKQPVFPPSQRLQLRHVIQVDHGRAVHAHEPLRIESLFQRVHGRPHEVLILVRVQRNVVAGRHKALDGAAVDEIDASSPPDPKPCEI